MTMVPANVLQMTYAPADGVAILVRADAAQIEQVQAMVPGVQEGLGVIDVLISNAEVFPRAPFSR